MRFADTDVQKINTKEKLKTDADIEMQIFPKRDDFFLIRE